MKEQSISGSWAVIGQQYGTYEAYFQAEFGLDKTRLDALKDKYLV